MADRSILTLARAHLANPIVRAVLCSRAHRLRSGNLLLLDYTGHRTGHRYVLPVGYAPASAGGDPLRQRRQHNFESQPAIGMDTHVYDSVTWLWILLWLVVWTVIGGVVGKGKGRTGAGIALGLFLSLIGVIIIAVMEPTPEKRAERAHEQALAMRGVFGPQPGVSLG